MARGGFDHSEFRRLYQATESIQKEFHSFLENFLLMEAAKVLRLVRPRTPVDTGNLRRMWQISNVVAFSDHLEVYLTNPVEYASHMEYGFTYTKSGQERKFPGFHMAEISIALVEQNMPRRFNASFEAWLRAKGWG